MVLSAEKLGIGDRAKFCSEKDRNSDDPLQTLNDIASNAISKQNHEMARIVICEIHIKCKELISEEINEEEAEKLTKIFGYHLFNIGKIAIANNDVESLDLIIKTMKNLNTLSINELAIIESIDYLIRIGSECAINDFIFNAYEIIDIFKDAAIKGNLRVTSSGITGINVIGNILIQKRSIHITQPSIIENLGMIAKQLLKEKETMNQNLENLRNISFLGGLPINYKIYDKSTSSFKLLEDIIKEREKRILELMEEILVSINALKRLSIIYEIKAEIFSANKVLNDIRATSDNQTIKESCASYLGETSSISGQ